MIALVLQQGPVAAVEYPQMDSHAQAPYEQHLRSSPRTGTLVPKEKMPPIHTLQNHTLSSLLFIY